MTVPLLPSTDAVSKNIVVDSELNLIQLAQQATSLTRGNISFSTLPITGFGTSPEGASINTVDINEVQATVKELLTPAPPATPTTPATPAAGGSATAAPQAAPAPAQQAASQTAATPPTPASNVYADSTGALQGGAIPCVK